MDSHGLHAAALQRLEDDFACYLREERGLADPTLDNYLPFVRCGIKPQYNRIKNLVNGCRIVQTNGKTGIMDSALNMCLPIQFDMIQILNDGLKVADNGILKLLSLDGKTVLRDTIFDDITHLYAYDPYYGEQKLYIEYGFCVFKVAERYGVFNSNGKVIIPALYSRIKMLTPDCFLCTVNDDYSFLLNSHGIEI